MKLYALIACFSASIVVGESFAAGPALEGPVSARVERIIDGDTVRVRAAIWIDQELMVNVRLDGLDAPEIFRPKCAAEKALGEAAKAFLETRLADRQVSLYGVRRGKYAGRVIARIETAPGADIGAALIGKGLAAPGRKGAWCGADA